MILNSNRLKSASKAAVIHFNLSLIVAMFAAFLVFKLWYPYPYREFSGGKELFVLVMVVDIVCGPLLTLVLFDPNKRRAELIRDILLVLLVQMAALLYGIHTVWQVPLYLVQEIDRFKVVSASQLEESALAALPQFLQLSLFDSPKVVAIRAPKDQAEREKVMVESLSGGPDYGERPDFYLPYEGDNALNSLKRAKALSLFLTMHVDQLTNAQIIIKTQNTNLEKLFYLPVVARQDWVAVLDEKGQILGFLKGDGF